MSSDDVRRLFIEVDGKLIWKERPVSDFKSQRDCDAWNTRFAGIVAGSDNIYKTNKRRMIGINGKLYQRAQLIWLLYKGSPPPVGKLLDHRNRDSLDDRISNLRLATHSQNCSNSCLHKHNTSGRRGVHWDKQSGKWQAKISVMKKVIYLGYFDDLDEAGDAYIKAAKKHFGEFIGAT